VRKNAVEAWGHLLDNRAKPEHLQKLEALVGQQGLDEQTFDEVVTVACRFAEEGALPTVQKLAKHPSADIRERVASQLYFNAAKKFTGKKELIFQLAQDSDARVRASAVLNFNNYLDDKEVVARCVQLADSDPSPKVIDKCLGTFSLGYSHGLTDQAFALWERHAKSPHEEVRAGLAQHMHWTSEKEPKRTQAIWEKLLTDPNEEVRRQAAFQFHNFHTMKQMLPFAMKMAESDPSEDVRYEVTGAMAGIADAKQLIPWYRQRLAADKSNRMQWAVLSGSRSLKDQQPAKELLVELTRSSDGDIANAAREALTD
jgi:HEAT repeat protein